jgi:hypothetical protein
MISDYITSNFKANALTDEELRLRAPSIFARSPMSGLSQRYAFVPTTEILTALREKHWVPVHVEQQRARRPVRLGFQKHLLRFRRAEQMQTLDEWNAELVLTNSHDAGCAYIMRIGIYRRLCSNGLVVSDENFEAIRFRHSGLKANEVIEASYHIMDYVPKLGALIDRFRNRFLTDTEALAFTKKALLFRFDNPEQAPVDPQALLTSRRPENLIRGGLSDGHRTRSGRTRTLRCLCGIDSKIALNKELWKLAEASLN